MKEFESLRPDLGRLQTIALVVGVLGLALAALGAFLNAQQFFQSYLYAYLFWCGVTLGSLALLLLQFLSGGRWGLLIRRTLEAGALTLPLMALLFVPFLFGLPLLYGWARPEAAANEIYQAKALYLNQPAFIIRAVLYFALWIAVAVTITRLSQAQDRSGNPALARRLRLLSAFGLLIYVLTITLATTDWAMSLDYTWYSTIYGMYFMVSQGLSTFAFVIVVLALLARQRPISDVIRPQLFHDLGTLLFAFVVLWAYMSFAQYLIIWSGNLAEEAPWYVRRSVGGWQYVALVLALFHFTLPFFLLLSRRIKTSTRLLTLVAGGIIIARLIDLFWIVGPEFYESVLSFSWTHLAAVVGIGGVWLALFAWLIQRRPFLPFNDPALPMVFAHE